MSRRGLLALAGLIAVAATGCDGLRYRSTTNAPGKITLAAPPRENGSPSLYVPAEDPGEHELYVGPGVVAGPGVGRVEVGEDDVAVEVGLYLRLAYAKKAKSHRRDDLPLPATGWALNLGWAPLQYAEHADIGPVYAELERDVVPRLGRPRPRGLSGRRQRRRAGHRGVAAVRRARALHGRDRLRDLRRAPDRAADRDHLEPLSRYSSLRPSALGGSGGGFGSVTPTTSSS
jgi:hypothetical protein